MSPLLLAAAALIAVAILWKTGGPRGELVRFAVLPTGQEAMDFHQDLGMPGSSRQELPRSWDTLRSGDSSGVEDFDYFERVAPLQEARIRASLSGKSTSEPTNSFVLTLQLERDQSAVVLLIDERGIVWGQGAARSSIAYPAAEPWESSSGRIAAGIPEVLPRRALVWGVAGERHLAPYSPGFVVPLGSMRLDVLMGLRDEVLGEPLRAELQALLAELAAQTLPREEVLSTLREWLLKRGFALQTSSVESLD